MNNAVETSSNEIVYASFWSRIAARLLDTIILYVPMTLIDNVSPDHGMQLVLELLLFLAYETLFLSSRWQGTPGKFLTGLKVSTENETRLSYKQALWRSLCAILSYSLLLPLLLLLFTEKKQTLHDKLAKTIVTDSTKSYAAVPTVTATRRKATGAVRFGLNTLFLVGIATILFYTVPMFVVYAMLYQSAANKYDYSFHVEHKTEDFNDTKIEFYNRELEKNVANFIEADDLYTRFEYDTKSDLAQECIDYHIALNHGDRFESGGYNFYKNARNKYTKTEKLIEKAKKNENLMGKHFYTYDMNMVHHAIEALVSYPDSGKVSPCQKPVEIDRLYDEFLTLYMRQFNEENIHGFSAPQQREIDWYEELKSRVPHVLQNIEQVKQAEHALALQRKQEQEEYITEKRAELKRDAKRHLNELAVSKKSNMSLLRELKAAGTDLNMSLQDGQTAIILAAKNENMELVKGLLDMGVDIKTKDRFGKNVLAYIDRDKYHDVYIRLKIRQAMDNTPFEGERMGAEASYNKKTGEVTVAQYGTNRKTWSPLILAIEKEDQKAVKHYIDQRLYLEQKTNNGSTAIFAAINFKNDQALEWLLDADVKLETKNNAGLTPLYAAVVKKNHYAVKRLLSSGADMYAMDEHNIYNPFTWAVDMNDIEMVKMFLDNDIDVNYQSKKNETALTIAAKGCRRLDIFKLLLRNGADPDIEDEYGNTTKTGLKRYCRQGSNYNEFYALIE